jgi:hypothetical protein
MRSWYAAAFVLAYTGIAAAAEEDRFESGFHAALAGGAGLAYGTAGVHTDVRIGSFALFAGIGLDLRAPQTPDATLALAAGLRAYTGPGEGLMVSVQAARSQRHCCESEGTREFDDQTNVYLGATIGVRLRHRSGLVFEASAGPALRRHSQDGFASSASSVPSPGCTRRGLQGYSCFARDWLLDATIGVGWEF